MKQRGECMIIDYKRRALFFTLSLTHHIIQCAYLMSCMSSHPAYNSHRIHLCPFYAPLCISINHIHFWQAGETQLFLSTAQLPHKLWYVPLSLYRDAYPHSKQLYMLSLWPRAQTHSLCRRVVRGASLKPGSPLFSPSRG